MTTALSIIAGVAAVVVVAVVVVGAAELVKWWVWRRSK